MEQPNLTLAPLHSPQQHWVLTHPISIKGFQLLAQEPSVNNLVFSQYPSALHQLC